MYINLSGFYSFIIFESKISFKNYSLWLRTWPAGQWIVVGREGINLLFYAV